MHGLILKEHITDMVIVTFKCHTFREITWNLLPTKTKVTDHNRMLNVTNISQHAVLSAHKNNHLYFAMSVNVPPV